MVLTIDDLLIQNGFYDDQVKSIKRNDEEGKALIQFKEWLEWGDCDVKIPQMLVLYDPITKYIKAYRIYGFNLEGICDYVDRHGSFLWNNIIHYMTDFDSFPKTITLITAAAMM